MSFIAILWERRRWGCSFFLFGVTRESSMAYEPCHGAWDRMIDHSIPPKEPRSPLMSEMTVKNSPSMNCALMHRVFWILRRELCVKSDTVDHGRSPGSRRRIEHSTLWLCKICGLRLDLALCIMTQAGLEIVVAFPVLRARRQNSSVEAYCTPQSRKI